MKNNNIYLDNSLYNEALLKYSLKLESIIKLERIKISSKVSCGKILAKPVVAKCSSPNFTASAMDGIAINYEKTVEASETNHITLIKDIDYIVVDTGDYISPEYNAVIMVEDLINISENKIKITKPVGFFENIRSVGEDIVESQMILPSNHKIRPVDVGAIIAGGVEFVEIYKPFTVGIMPTGSEIVDVSKKNLEKGDIIDSNSYMLKGLVEEMGFKAVVNDIVKDDYDLLKENIIKLTNENDIVFINAGSSAGTEDFTKDILAELGEVIIHGVAIKPGKPVILSIVNDKMVVGIPGYPVACFMIFEKIIKPILENILKIQQDDISLKVTLVKQINSSLKHLEFVRVKLGFINDKYVATPLARGAGVSMSLVDCDGILEIPKSLEGYEAGDEVYVKLFKNLSEIENRLTAIGSHDMILDLMKELFHNDFYDNFAKGLNRKKVMLSSTHLGSFGGIMALRNKECNIAPIHILDEKTGVYNISSIEQFFPNEKMALIKGVKRQQGLFVQKGNPKNIKCIEDLKKHKFINRQKGSGTYTLLKYILKTKGISTDDVVGFDFNVPTHYDVAINVKEGIADCGLGIYSVANSLDLDFIHITNEDYDFLIYEKDLEKENIKKFIEVLKSEELKEKLELLGGYEFSNIGTVITL